MHIYSAIFAILLLLSPTLADFHIGEQVHNDRGITDTTDFVACPSNYYKCNCFGMPNPASDRGVYIKSGQSPASNSFSLDAGLCGMGQLNFYYRQDKGGWDFYVNGGDGSLQGTCYPNLHAKDEGCPIFQYTYKDLLVCYSYICKSWLDIQGIIRTIYMGPLMFRPVSRQEGEDSKSGDRYFR